MAVSGGSGAAQHEQADAARDRRERPATRRRILEAAAEVFAHKGYYQAAVDDIVRASRTSKGSFYHFFPSKQGIFLALVDMLSDQLLSRVEKAIAAQQGALRQIDAALATVIDVFARHRRLARILLIEAAGLGHAFNQKLFSLHARIAELIRRQLERALAEGVIPPLDPEVAAYAWLGAINEIVLRWLYTEQPQDLRDALPQLRALLFASIKAPSGDEESTA